MWCFSAQIPRSTSRCAPQNKFCGGPEGLESLHRRLAAAALCGLHYEYLPVLRRALHIATTVACLYREVWRTLLWRTPACAESPAAYRNHERLPAS